MELANISGKITSTTAVLFTIALLSACGGGGDGATSGAGAEQANQTASTESPESTSPDSTGEVVLCSHHDEDVVHSPSSPEHADDHDHTACE